MGAPNQPQPESETTSSAPAPKVSYFCARLQPCALATSAVGLTVPTAIALDESARAAYVNERVQASKGDLVRLLRDRPLLAAALAFMHFPVFMGLWVMAAEALADARAAFGRIISPERSDIHSV
jgi:hypothetical protein